MSAPHVGPLEQSLDELFNAAYADGRADQLMEDVARLREWAAKPDADHGTALRLRYAALVLLEKQ